MLENKIIKKEFALNQRVIIDEGMGEVLAGATGKVLGKSFNQVFAMYIVLLDEQLPNNLAVVVPEFGLTAI